MNVHPGIRQWLVAFCLIAAVVQQSACGGGSTSSANSSTGGGGTGVWYWRWRRNRRWRRGSSGGNSVPQFAHVFLVVEENHSFSDVIGNSSMPYLNGLATANSLATQYYADAHPSLPNYFMLTVGEGTSITGSAGDSYNGVVTQDNVVRALTAAGKTWKCYAESLPSVGYLGGDDGAYLQHHNPFVYFSDVQSSATQAGNIVPFTQLATDIANNALPDYAFIVPNVNDDAHNCPAGMSTCTQDQQLGGSRSVAVDKYQPSARKHILSKLADDHRFRRSGRLGCNEWRWARSGCDRQSEGESRISIYNAVSARKHAAVDDGRLGRDGPARSGGNCAGYG